MDKLKGELQMEVVSLSMATKAIYNLLEAHTQALLTKEIEGLVARGLIHPEDLGNKDSIGQLSKITSANVNSKLITKGRRAFLKDLDKVCKKHFGMTGEDMASRGIAVEFELSTLSK